MCRMPAFNVPVIITILEQLHLREADSFLPLSSTAIMSLDNGEYLATICAPVDLHNNNSAVNRLLILSLPLRSFIVSRWTRITEWPSSCLCSETRGREYTVLHQTHSFSLLVNGLHQLKPSSFILMFIRLSFCCPVCLFLVTLLLSVITPDYKTWFWRVQSCISTLHTHGNNQWLLRTNYWP